FLQTTNFEVLDQHVGGGDQFPDGLRTLRGREVDSYGALAAVGRVIIGGRQVFTLLAGDEGGAPFAGVVAAVGVLDLDDISAEIGKHLTGPWSREDAGKFDDADAFERWVGHFF